jgi:hypothetical protein
MSITRLETSFFLDPIRQISMEGKKLNLVCTFLTTSIVYDDYFTKQGYHCDVNINQIEWIYDVSYRGPADVLDMSRLIFTLSITLKDIQKFKEDCVGIFENLYTRATPGSQRRWLIEEYAAWKTSLEKYNIHLPSSIPGSSAQLLLHYSFRAKNPQEHIDPLLPAASSCMTQDSSIVFFKTLVHASFFKTFLQLPTELVFHIIDYYVADLSKLKGSLARVEILGARHSFDIAPVYSLQESKSLFYESLNLKKENLIRLNETYDNIYNTMLVNFMRVSSIDREIIQDHIPNLFKELLIGSRTFNKEDPLLVLKQAFTSRCFTNGPHKIPEITFFEMMQNKLDKYFDTFKKEKTTKEIYLNIKNLYSALSEIIIPQKEYLFHLDVETVSALNAHVIRLGREADIVKAENDPIPRKILEVLGIKIATIEKNDQNDYYVMMDNKNCKKIMNIAANADLLDSCVKDDKLLNSYVEKSSYAFWKDKRSYKSILHDLMNFIIDTDLSNLCQVTQLVCYIKDLKCHEDFINQGLKERLDDLLIKVAPHLEQDKSIEVSIKHRNKR